MLPNPTSKNFPDALQKARKSAGLTQEELAKKAGVAKVMPGRYERGIHVPDMENWGKINRALFPDAKESEIVAAQKSKDSMLSEASIEEILEELKRRGFAKVSLSNA
jgi:predicted transcriptional regulator